MAAPDSSLTVTGPTGNKSTSREALEGAIDAVTDIVWEQMHLLAADGLIDLVSEAVTAPNIITAQLRGAHADTPPQGGVTYVIRIPTVGLPDTGPFLIKVGAGDAWPVIDEDGATADLAAFVKGRHYYFRRGLDSEASFRAVDTDRSVWEQVARGDVMSVLTNSVAGTANAVNARLSSVYNRLTIGPGTKFMVPFRQTNSGPMTFQIIGKDPDPVPLLNADGNPCAPGEVMAGRTYVIFRSGSTYKLRTDFTLQQLEAMIAAGGGGGGGGGEAEERAHIGAYLDGSNIRAVGDDDGLVANLGSLTAVSAVEGGRYASLVVDKPGIGANSLVGGYPGYSLLAPCSPQLLRIILVYGQSLAIGSHSGETLVTTSQPWPSDALMFAGPGIDVRMGLGADGREQVLDPSTLTGFQPLVAMPGYGFTNRGETLAEGFGKRTTSLAREMNIQHRTLLIVGGYGGSSYDEIKKGAQLWTNLMLGVARAKELAEERGWRVIVDGVMWKHGEANGTTSSYGTMLGNAIDDFNTDLKAITGQQADVHMFVQQHSTFSSGTSSVLGMANAGATNPLIHVTGADYPFRDAYSPDYLHFLGPGYELIGEQMAMAFRDVMWRPTPSASCLRFTGASRTGNLVNLAYPVPAPPLVIDTTTLTNDGSPGDPTGQRGFRFFAGSTEIPITAVTVTDNAVSDNIGVVRLTLASTPAGGTERVDYALDLQSDPKTFNNVPRGCVRDSATERSLYDNRRLYRWAIHQSVTL